mmetsp:Transcript_10329/g.15836  ORF Transcript_10329/g.15836 Transcript_10329/m.15836 type:complete len:251 (-) Transcript_10329:153-905(-)
MSNDEFLRMFNPYHQEGREGYNPDIVEFDDFLEEGVQQETVLFSEGLNPKEIGKVIKIGTGKHCQKKPENMPEPTALDDDDEIIDYFMQNNNQNWEVCEFFLQGDCRFGSSCRNKHPESMRPMVDHFKDSNPGYNPNATKEEQQIENDGACVICLDMVLASGKKFGILENCSHVFCLDCIRNWRATYDKKVKKTHYRTCPICRTNSYLVIPSSRKLEEGDLKNAMLDEYTDTLSAIPCKHFNEGKGFCPF